MQKFYVCDIYFKYEKASLPWSFSKTAERARDMAQVHSALASSDIQQIVAAYGNFKEVLLLGQMSMVIAGGICPRCVAVFQSD
jgi:hypothetical protein